MYLPLFSQDDDQDDIPVFYGAISIYLKQKFSFFKHAPQWLENILNSGPMLKFAAGMANSTRATGLEDMTISMLMGEHGKQKEELEKMVHWLEHHVNPDVIHISNALLLGLAHKLKQRLKVPIVCSLQDEDVWVDDMNPEMGQKVWDLIREKAVDVDMFIPVSHYYTSFMMERLHLPLTKISTLHLGVDPSSYEFIPANQKPRTIGYLSRLCRENGLDILVDAFILLKKMDGNSGTRLVLTGGFTADDKQYIRQQKEKIKKAGLSDQVEIIHKFDGAARDEFFSKVQVISVPVRNGEAFGIYLTEAMAAGIPVVQPALGAFPEIVEKSKGGICYEKNTPEQLALALNGLLSDKKQLTLLSHQGRESMENQFNIHGLAKQMISIYRKAISQYNSTENIPADANNLNEPA